MTTRLLALVALAAAAAAAAATATGALPTPERQAALDRAESLRVAAELGLPADAEGNLLHNTLLLSDASDAAQWPRAQEHKWYEVRTARSDAFLTHVADGNRDVVAACLWRGVPLFTLRDVVRSSGRFATAATALPNPSAWFRETCQKTEIGFISYFEGETLTATWIHPDTKQPAKGYDHQLRAGEKNTLWITSYVGHQFLMKGKSFSKTYDVKFPSIHIVGPKPDYASEGHSVPGRSREHRMKSELERVNKITRVFTDVGFKKIKCPNDLWGEVKTYWNNNRGRSHRAIEEWRGGGWFVNWWEVNQDLVVPPMQLKRRWQEMFMPVVEAWAGTKLEPTDIYGIRTYYDGAWLSNHVDREQTHAASAIVNVEQVNVSEPWHVHIWDIHGKRHLVTLEPGYALLYESARCMHGRPVPLRGAEYTNVFTHYRPAGNPNWFSDRSVGMVGPDVSAAFNPNAAATHDSGLVGAEAAAAFKGYPVDVDEVFRDEL